MTAFILRCLYTQWQEIYPGGNTELRWVSGSLKLFLMLLYHLPFNTGVPVLHSPLGTTVQSRELVRRTWAMMFPAALT